MKQSSAWSSLDVIDFMGLGLIGTYILFSSIYASDFAEIHLTLPSIPVPIFISEILLAICLCLFLTKIVLLRAFPQGSLIWGTYGLLVLIFAVLGYKEYGLLSFRNAALFYYALFAFLSFHFYNQRLFEIRWLNIILVLSFFAATLGVWGKQYYCFTYSMLAMTWILCSSSLKMPPLVKRILIGIILVKYIFLLLGSRSHLVALMGAMWYVLMIWVFCFMRARLIVKFGLIVLVMCGLFITTKFVCDPNALTTLMTPDEIIRQFKKNDALVEKRKAKYEMKAIPINLYNDNSIEYNDQKLKRINEQLKKEKEQQATTLDLNQVKQERLEQAHIILNPVSDHPSKATKHSKSQSHIEAVSYQTSSIADHHEISPQEPEKKTIEENLPTFTFRKIGRDHEAYRRIDDAYGNILFRLFIWRDMFQEMWEKKAIFGFGLGKPQRSKSLEMLFWGTTEWTRDGWIATHNSFFFMLYRAGIVGLALIILMLVVYYRLTVFFIQRKVMAGIFLLGALMYWMLLSNFLVILELPYNAIAFWSLFGLIYRYHLCVKANGKA